MHPDALAAFIIEQGKAVHDFPGQRLEHTDDDLGIAAVMFVKGAGESVEKHVSIALNAGDAVEASCPYVTIVLEELEVLLLASAEFQHGAGDWGGGAPEHACTVTFYTPRRLLHWGLGKRKSFHTTKYM